MKKYYICFIAAFMALTISVGAFVFLTPDTKFSQMENRYLQLKPKLSGEDIMSAKTQTQINDYLSDQFPFRDALTLLQTRVKTAIGKKDIKDVYLGDGGQYFEKVTENDINYSRYEKNLDRLENAARENDGVKFSAMLVPPAACILSDKLPDFAPVCDFGKMYDTAAKRLDICRFIDLRASLKGHGDEYLYYRTDHHWTVRGAYYGYCAFTEKNGVAKNITTAADGFLGSLYSKAPVFNAVSDAVDIYEYPNDVSVVSDGKQAEVYDKKALTQKDKYKVFFGGNFGYTQLNGGCDNNKTLVIVKDSFANCFVPYLAEDYESIIMIDMRYFNGSIGAVTESSKADEVLFLYELCNFAGDKNLVMLSAH